MAYYNRNEINKILEEAINTVTQSSNAWADFLKKSAYIYEYNFINRFMIAHQKPNATFVNDYNTWQSYNSKVIKRGSGIPIIGANGSRKYVFDVSDTNYTEPLWQPDIINSSAEAFHLYTETFKNTTAENIKSVIDNAIQQFTNSVLYAKDPDKQPRFIIDDKKYIDDYYNLIENSLRVAIYERLNLNIADISFDLDLIRNVDKGNFFSFADKIINDGVKRILNKTKETVLTLQQENIAQKQQIFKHNNSNNYVRYTEAEIEQAKRTNLVDFLQRNGESIKRVGSNEYTMENHDSMRIRDNKFYWNSQNTGGNALDFCMKYYNMDFREAVSSLLSFNGYNRDNYEPPISSNIQSQKQEPPQPEPIINPLPNELDTKTNRVYAYLTKTRMIDVDVVQELINDGKIAQDIKGNAVFKIFDPTAPNELSGAEITGTLTEKRYKQVTERNGNGFTFNPSGSAPESAIFFEAAVDLLSYYSLHKDTKALLVSMAGLKDKVVLKTIADYKLNPEQCFISSDNDEAGFNFAIKMEEKHGVSVHRVIDDPLFNNYSNANIKDWNDLLKEVKNHQNIEHSQAKNVSEAKKEIGITKSVEDLAAGDYILGDGDLWKIKSISFENNSMVLHHVEYDYDLPFDSYEDGNTLKEDIESMIKTGSFKYLPIGIEFDKNITLYKVGDFYEALNEDAAVISDVLNINITSKAVDNDRLPLVGFPKHILSDNVLKLAENNIGVNLGNYNEFVNSYIESKQQSSNTDIEEKPLSANLAGGELSFAEQVDNVLNGTANRYDDLKVCDTPQILLDVGLEQLPMLYTQKHLNDALRSKSILNPHWHGLTVEQIKSIPDLIKNPAIIFDSISSDNPKSIGIVLNAVDNDNAPILVTVKPNGKGIYELEKTESNFITSIYGKDNSFEKFIERIMQKDNLLFVDKEKSQELSRLLKLQLFKGVNNLDYDIIIHQSRNIVNKNTETSGNISEVISENIQNQESNSLPIFNAAQSKVIKDAEAAGLSSEDISVFAQPQYHYTVMAAALEAYKSGFSNNQVSSLMEYSSAQINEIVKALKNPTATDFHKNFIMNKDFSEKEMQQVNRAINLRALSDKMQILTSGKFDWTQMFEIVNGIEDNLSVEQLQIIANDSLNSAQMFQIRRGFNEGLSIDEVKSYINPNLDNFAMAQKIEAIKSHNSKPTKRELQKGNIDNDNNSVSEKISEIQQETLNTDEIYKAFQEHKTIKLTDISSNSNEINLIENARKNNFYNIRLEYNNATTDDLNAGFVMRADTGEEKDVVLRNYGEQSPEEMYSLIKDDYAVTGIEERTLSDKLARSELSFSEQIDMALNNELPFYTSLKVCDTPQILLDSGCRQLPMLFTQRHLKNALADKKQGDIHKHGLTLEQIKELPSLIEHPVMIYDSLSRNDSMVMVTSEFDKDNLPVIVSITPNGSGRYELETIDSNFITSVHGRENFKNQFLNAVSNDKMIFCDKEKSQEMFERWGLQLSELTNSLDFNIIIHQSNNIVNKNEEVSEKLSEINAENVLEISEAETTKNEDTQQNKIIGNEPYKYVYQKENIQVDSNIADNVISQLEAADFRFYGEINDDNSVTLFTLSRHHLFELDKIIKDVQQQQKVNEPVSLMSDESKININGPEITNIQNLEPLENDNVDNVDIALTTDETTENDIEQQFNDIYSDLYNNYDTDEKMSSISNEFKSAVNAFDEVIINNPQKYPEINNLYKDFVISREDIITSDREAAAFMFALNNGIKYVDVNALEKKVVRNVVETELTLSANLSKSVNSHNYHINNYEIASTPKAKYRDNISAIKTLFALEKDNRQATEEEQTILAKYVGWGGLPDAFDSKKDNWKNEYTELKELLTDDEYNAARSSTLNAHYTSAEVINAMYATLTNLGFNGGKILEPALGNGRFFGLLPENWTDKTKLYGVELDSITGRIAKKLYPEAYIQVKGFEKTNFKSNTFDAAISNVPFGNYRVSDKDFKSGELIHDYFFKKSLDKVRPGGIVAFITSKGTLDKQDNSVRKYLAERADLLGAVRLPNNAFSSANTGVTSDIIFLQKRDTLRNLTKNEMPDWINLAKDENGIEVNSYFINNPNMVCGIMAEVNGRYGIETTCKPYKDIPLSDLLNNAISNINGKYNTDEIIEDNSITKDNNIIPENYRNFCYAIINNDIYYRENDTMIKQDFSGKRAERIRGQINISTALQELITAQKENAADTVINNLQLKLNGLYDSFTKDFGFLNDKVNKSIFRDDDTAPLLLSLENLDKNGELESKADIFFKRTILPHNTVNSVDTSAEALTISISEKAKVDLDFMSQLCSKSKDEIISDLKGVIFENPLTGIFENSDEYLSGNVREKLEIAKKYADNDSKYNVNVQFLESVQPEPLKPAEISAQLGSTWIPVKFYEQFMYTLLETPNRCISSWAPYYSDPFSSNNNETIAIDYNAYTSTYSISNKGNMRADANNILAYSVYGTKRINAYKIIEDTLNLKTVTVKDYIEDDEGKKREVINKKETMLAQEKQNITKQKFKEWVFDDYNRTQTLCNIYNEKFNSYRLREYDGSHIKFVGMNPEIQLRQHQKDAIAHTLYGGNTLLAHTVGAGKSFEMIASAMESKRLGLFTKSMIVVPKSIVNQMAKEFLQLYPSANILVPSASDFTTANRKHFCSRIATGNYDAIIISHDQLEKIPLSRERQIKFIKDQINEITDFLVEISHTNNIKGYTVKQLENTKKNLETRLKNLNNDDKRDTTITFEELGVDKLYIDEAHEFKNKYFYTKMNNVAGISTSASQKSEDLFMKCRYLDEKTNYKGIVFATGTPISNSMVELYTLQTYLQYDVLKSSGLSQFDAWASTFGETQLSLELAPEGTGYRQKTRFSKFTNIPELMNIFKTAADIKTADVLNLPVPKANFHTISTEPTVYQKDMINGLAKRAENIRKGRISQYQDNMLNITNEGRKIALDQRVINPLLPDEPQSKVNVCIENVFDIWKNTADKRSTQLIFCDMSTPSSTFNIYDDVKSKLINKGIPQNEIAFIHDYNNDAKKLELFTKVQNGDIRILLGSTKKLGTGTNCQNKLTALHHLDCPYRPSDLEQRNGRGIRQGNENAEIDIYTYVTKGTFDAYLYQLVENKQKFISQIMTSKTLARFSEDIDECVLNYAEVKAIASGNPKIKEKIDLDIEVNRLRTLFAGYQENKRTFQEDITKKYPQKIQRINELISGYETDKKLVDSKTSNEFAGMNLNGIQYGDKKAAGTAFLDLCRNINTNSKGTNIGEYRGFKMTAEFNPDKKQFEVTLKNSLSYTCEIGTDIYGNITRLDNTLNNISKSLDNAKILLEDTKTQLATAKEEVKKPFPQLRELRDKENLLNKLNAELSGDKYPDEEKSQKQSLQQETSARHTRHSL